MKQDQTASLEIKIEKEYGNIAGIIVLKDDAAVYENMFSGVARILAKEKKGLANFFDNQKKEIIVLIQNFPNTLSLEDQGRFFLGYYHQKAHRENQETEE